MELAIKTITNYLKTNWKDIMSMVFFLVCYGTSICLFLGGVKDQTKPSDLDFSIFLPLAIADIVLILMFINIERIFFKMKINIPLIIILSCLFIINLVVITTTPLENSVSYTYLDSPGIATIIITNEYKIMYILCFLLLLLNIYISINYLIQRVNFNKQFIWISWIVIIVGLFMIVYSYITEMETYKMFFENITKIIKWFNPTSLTANPNSYASILLGAEFCSFGLYFNRKKNIYWIIGLFFCINMIFPMSRICLLLSFGLVLLFIIYKLIVTWKKHTFRNLNFVFLLILPFCIFVPMCITIPELRNYVVQILFTDNSAFNSRIPLWNLTISMTHNFHHYIGNGHGYYNTVLTTILNGEPKMPHNLYIQTYGALGFLGLTLFATLICFIIYEIVRLYKNNRDASLISVIGLIIVLTYYLVEG